jgi:hypothetical protein
MRALIAAVSLLAAAPALQAESGPWSGMLGAATPAGATRQWVGSTVGPSLDIMETYTLGTHDAIRMRFGYWDLKASRDMPDNLIVPGQAAAPYPANTTNEIFGFTYSAEYVYTLPARFYVLGGLGVTYVSATRTGTFDLSSIGSGKVSTNYGTNNFVPCVSLGLGFQLTSSLALEARWQTATMKDQKRPIDLTSVNLGVGQEVFSKLNVSTLTVGLNVNF